MSQIDEISDDFETLLNNKTFVNYFCQFLKKEFSDENLEFWLKCEQFKKITNHKERKRLAKHIYETYISINACNAININRNCSEMVFNLLSNPSHHLFDFPQNEIFNLMKFDCYQRFLSSDIYKRYKDCNRNKNSDDLRLECESADVSDECKAMIKPRRRSLIPWHRIKSYKLQKDDNEKLCDSSKKKKHKFESISGTNMNAMNVRNNCSCNNDYCEKCEHSNPSQIHEKVKIGQILQKLIKTERPDKPSLTPNIIFSDDTKSDAFFENIMLSSQHIPVNESLCSFSPNPILHKRSKLVSTHHSSHFTLSDCYNCKQSVINDIDLDEIQNNLKHVYSNTNISETESTLTASQLYPNELNVENDLFNSFAINQKQTITSNEYNSLSIPSTPPPLPPKAIKTRAPPRPLVHRRYKKIDDCRK